jgi:hypothetical protein
MSTISLPQMRRNVNPARRRPAASPRPTWHQDCGRYILMPHTTPYTFLVVKAYDENWEEISVDRRATRCTGRETCTCEARSRPDCRHRKQVRFFREYFTCPVCGTSANPANDWCASFHYDSVDQPDLRIDSPFDVLDMVCLPCETLRRKNGGAYGVPRTSHWRTPAFFTRAEARDIATVIESYKRRDPFYLPGRRD